MKKCKNCGAVLPDTAKFCNVCGTGLTDSANYTEVNEDGSEVGSGSEEKPKFKKCRQCGNIVSDNAKFCNICGADMRNSANYTMVEETENEPVKEEAAHTETEHVSPEEDSDESIEMAPLTQENAESPEGNPAEPVHQAKKCKICGSIVAEDAKFCNVCGADMRDQANYTLIGEKAEEPAETPEQPVEKEELSSDESEQNSETSENDAEQATEPETIPGPAEPVTPETTVSSEGEDSTVTDETTEPAPEEGSEEKTEQAGVSEEKESSGTKIKKCRNCGNIVSDSAKFCNVCGADMNNPANYVLEEATTVAPEQNTEASDQEAETEEPAGKKVRKCRNCGNIVSDTAKFCNVCGADMQDPANYTMVEEEQVAPVRKVRKCNRCGTIILDDDIRFCNSCGNDLQNPANYTMVDEPNCGVDAEQIRQSVAQAGAAAGTAVNNVVKSDQVQGFLHNKKAVAGVVVAVVIVVVLLIVHAVMPVRINLADYTTINVTGYNGYGTAEVKINKTKLGNDIRNAAMKKNTTMYLSELDDFDLDYHLSQTDNLSNDDTVTLTWGFSKDELKDLKISLNTKDIDKKVSDLKTVDTFDAFKDIKVQVSGVAPYGEAKLNKESKDGLIYKLNKTTGLDNGDKVKVTISSSYDDDRNFTEYVDKHGKMPEKTSRTYEVSDLNTYVTTASDLTDDAIKKMTSQAEDVIKANDANNLDDDVTLNSLTYQGLYFLKAKDRKDDDDDDYYDDAYNKVYIVELQTFTDEDYDGNQMTVKAYTAVEFNSISKAKDGTINVDLNDYSTLDNMFLPNDDYDYSSVYGYESQDDLYKECVTSQADQYTSETKAPSK